MSDITGNCPAGRHAVCRQQMHMNPAQYESDHKLTDNDFISASTANVTAVQSTVATVLMTHDVASHGLKKIRIPNSSVTVICYNNKTAASDCFMWIKPENMQCSWNKLHQMIFLSFHI